MKEIKRDAIMAIVMLAVALGLLVITNDIKAILQTEEVGPRFTPRLVAAGLAFLSLLQLILTFVKYKKRKAQGTLFSESQTGSAAAKKTLWSLLGNEYAHIVTWFVILVFGMAMSQIGFIVSSVVIMFVCTFFMCPRKERNMRVFIIASVAVPVVTYFVFVKFFFLMLPVGNLWKNLGLL